jgi:hypothetical protein
MESVNRAPLDGGKRAAFAARMLGTLTGGAGLGAMWGTELARETLAGAGFSQVEVVDSPRPQNCIYMCRP